MEIILYAVYALVWFIFVAYDVFVEESGADVALLNPLWIVWPATLLLLVIALTIRGFRRLRGWYAKAKA